MNHIRPFRVTVAVIVVVAMSILGLVASSCRRTDSPSASGEQFDRKAFLRDVATNLIVPSYRDAQARINTLQSTIQVFVQTPNEQSLRTAQAAWIEAYKVWLRAAPYDFGPADGTFGTLRQNIATFPINTTLTESFIVQQKVDLNNFNRDTRGLLGIEYLLFSESVLDNTVARFSGERGAARRQYLTAIINDVKSRLDTVAAPWLSTVAGNYVETFVANDGTAIGSSTSMLFNEFVKSYEELKNFKFGVPLGLRAGQAKTEPDKVEGVYSGLTLEFAKLHFEVVQNIWAGRIGTAAGAQDFRGFEEYLASVAGGTELIASTKQQIAAVSTALNAIPTTPAMKSLISQNHPSLVAAHTELQKQTRFFKSDMSSLMGIAITFSSGDGD